ncbi:unnamed protein product [Adineta steineri]|uniref:Aminopeptidase n=1 Tax=Adineta steineri TaxID=433720 RepID=A0A818NI52_9BILA|nr:unnamed protein product [Adineta steineri]CAF3604275.1 unnamed protein product [Adineta steineri]
MMEGSQDDLLIMDHDYSRRLFLRKKISLTTSTCVLLIMIFFSSLFVVSITSFYLTESPICYVTNNVEKVKSEEPTARPIYISRPKRSLTPKKVELCMNPGCCPNLDPTAPWEKPRLPTNVYPEDYQLELSLFQLNQPTDTYSGAIDIVLGVRSPTNEIILHADGLLYSDVFVTKRSSPNDTQLNVECIVPFPNTQTVVIRVTEQLEKDVTYDVKISFFRALNIHGTGLFESQFNKDQFGLQKSRIILTHFEPVHAREAYPCFDEPGFKTKFQLTVKHDNNTQILSNWDEEESFVDGAWLQTEFQTVPPIPTALTAFAVFYTDDFDRRSASVVHPITGHTIDINLWARKQFFTNDGGIYVDAPLLMTKNILQALLNIFQDIQTHIVPKKIDILAVPEYPSDAVSHWGLIIFTEQALLHNYMTTSELEHQRIALLIAKELAEQWYGNFISFKWWTDLWLQEAIANYLKYHAVNAAYPTWNIHDQFAVTELQSVMFDDSMSTSHPILKSVNSATEIDELYDSIETTKATAILRMADYYMEKSTNIKNNTLTIIIDFLRDHQYGFLIPDELLGKYRIGSWSGPDFFDRWLLQSNYPKIFARILHNTADNTSIFQLSQSRFLSAHMYEYDLYPASVTPFGYTWYIPITCKFGTTSNELNFTRTFYLDTTRMDFPFGTLNYQYFYCNTDFAGYYIMDYTAENWGELSAALDNNNPGLLEIDRANLLNNAFLSAQSNEESYSIVRGVTQFLVRDAYKGILSWQALSYHVNRMLDVLEYESLYGVVQKYFRFVVRRYYTTFETTLWNDDGTFSEQILKNTIIQLACRLQLPECIDKATVLWNDAYPSLVNGEADHSIVDHAREVVYRTHFQNTYNDSEWITIESDYHNFVDVQERYRLLEAMTQSRQPWHLYQLLYRDAEPNKDTDVDLLQVLTLLAKNPVGRELVWLYYRKHWAELQTTYGRTNQRLGQLLMDITATFEDEFHEVELIDFLASTPGVNTNVDARFWALERANMNFWWIVDGSKDMAESFDLET